VNFSSNHSLHLNLYYFWWASRLYYSSNPLYFLILHLLKFLYRSMTLAIKNFNEWDYKLQLMKATKKHLWTNNNPLPSCIRCSVAIHLYPTIMNHPSAIAIVLDQAIIDFQNCNFYLWFCKSDFAVARCDVDELLWEEEAVMQRQTEGRF
jgi:hypothetical protein